MTTVQETLRSKLTQAFNPLELEVRDDSHLHAGHAGSRPEGETHFSVHIVAEAFDGLSRVARHRLVNEVLAEDLAGRVHALAIKADTPGK